MHPEFLERAKSIAKGIRLERCNLRGNQWRREEPFVGRPSNNADNVFRKRKPLQNRHFRTVTTSVRPGNCLSSTFYRHVWFCFLLYKALIVLEIHTFIIQQAYFRRKNK